MSAHKATIEELEETLRAAFAAQSRARTFQEYVNRALSNRFHKHHATAATYNRAVYALQNERQRT